MATSPDHPSLQFVQAKGYTKGRADGPPLWVVIHDMEASETPTRAESTAAYFQSPSDGRNVSSHYCVDDNSVVQCVLLSDVAWTVGNRPGNYRGINWELAGFASQTREQWLDTYGTNMFNQMMPIMRADMTEYGIPATRCTIDDLKAFKKGITSHNDLRVAFGGTTHTDPGSNFPWDYFMDLLKGEDMTPEQALSLERIESYVFWETLGQRDPIVVPGDTVNHPPNKLAQQLAAIRQTQAAQQAQLDRIEAAIGSGGVHHHETGPAIPD
jgi:N-acetylmuramoyl-L-alanine amidase